MGENGMGDDGGLLEEPMLTGSTELAARGSDGGKRKGACRSPPRISAR